MVSGVQPAAPALPKGHYIDLSGREMILDAQRNPNSFLYQVPKITNLFNKS